jgi:hypothetical protein
LELFVTLTTERKAELVDEAAQHHAKLEALEAKKDREMKAINAEIKAEEEHISRILRVVRGQGENKDQLDMKFGEDSRVTEEAAQQALAALRARQRGCSPIRARSCEIHGTCSCEPMLRKCATCDHVETENQGQGVYMCPNCPDTTLLQVLPEGEGDAPDVASPDCVLHGVGAPHATEPPAAELTEPQIIEALAREAVAEWARLGKTPESRVEVNTAVKLAIAATSMPVKRRKPFRQAVDRLLGDESVPANHGASDAPHAEEPGDDAGNVAEAEA